MGQANRVDKGTMERIIMNKDESIVLKTVSRERLKEYFNGVHWYHFIDTGLGIVTQGAFDYRNFLDKFRFPESLKGKTVLDVGACNGYFSFLFEKKGAKKVLAIDTDKYDGSLPISFSPRFEENFKKKYSRDARYYEEFKDIYGCLGLKGSNNLMVLADIFRSKVEWKNHSVYELDKLNEKFDFVFCGAMIEHLKNPIEGVEQLYNATKQLCIISLSDCLYWWPINLISKIASTLKVNNPFKKVVLYQGNVSGGSFFYFHPLAFKELLIASGFPKVEIVSFFKIRNQKRSYVRYSPIAIFHCYK
jgi:2-polyprenyl-3-methyl-5-hydroxy-6-metoxy-1,4-benzoquinol methylase